MSRHETLNARSQALGKGPLPRLTPEEEAFASMNYMSKYYSTSDYSNTGSVILSKFGTLFERSPYEGNVKRLVAQVLNRTTGTVSIPIAMACRYLLHDREVISPFDTAPVNAMLYANYMHNNRASPVRVSASAAMHVSYDEDHDTIKVHANVSQGRESHHQAGYPFRPPSHSPHRVQRGRLLVSYWTT
jgi:hypothetical protein